MRQKRQKQNEAGEKDMSMRTETQTASELKAYYPRFHLTE